MMEIHREATASDVGIRGLRWIHPKKIAFWESLAPRVLTEDEPIHGIDPPPFKCIHHRCRARSGYDTRAGIMRECA